MIFNAVRKEMNMSNNLDRNTSLEFQPIVISSETMKQSPGSRKHKYEEENEEGASNVSKCQRSNSLGSYFHPIVPEIENCVKASDLNFNELEIVDDSLNSPKQPESVFQFVNSVESSMSKNLRSHSHSETAESKFTSNIADDPALFCNSACDDLNSDPRFFQSQSAPALLLTYDDDVRASSIPPQSPHTPQNSTSTTHSSLYHLHPSSESAAKANKVNIHPDFEYKLLGFSSTDQHYGNAAGVQHSSESHERKGLSISTTSAEEWNNDDFDALTTGDSSLSGSSRRSAAPSRSSHASYSSSRYSSSDKVSTYSDDTHTTYSTRAHSTGYRTSSGYSGSDAQHSEVYGRSPRRHSHSHSRRSSAHARDSRSNDRSESSQYRHNANTTRSVYSTHSTGTTQSTQSTHTTYSTTSSGRSTHRCSSSHETAQVSSSVRGVYQTTSSMYSGVYSTTGDSHSSYSSSGRSPTPPRSAPSAYNHSSNNSGNYTDRSDYSDSHAMHTHTTYPSPPSSSPSTTTNYSSHILSLKTVPATKPVNFRYYRAIHYCDLPLEWWERTDHCKEAKLRHTDRIDHMCGSRESLVLKTTLWKDDVVLEPNMFPYYTPYGVEHYTLWSIDDMTHQQIVSFVDRWLHRHMPQVRRWQYDDNSGERSIDLFHVHVFIETAPYTYAPRDGMLYVPPHALAEQQQQLEQQEGRSADCAILL